MASKIKAFVHLRGKVDDEKIAEMAKVKVETVKAYWRKLDAEAEANTAVEIEVAREAAAGASPWDAFMGQERAKMEADAAQFGIDPEGLQDEELAARVLTAAGYKGASIPEEFRAEPEVDADEDAEVVEPVKATEPEPEPEPKPAKVPSCVRVTRSTWMKTEKGLSKRIGLRDVYTGEMAAFLWAHHRDVVEAFPPKE